MADKALESEGQGWKEGARSGRDHSNSRRKAPEPVIIKPGGERDEMLAHDGMLLDCKYFLRQFPSSWHLGWCTTGICNFGYAPAS
jgi:hypothetical protein